MFVDLASKLRIRITFKGSFNEDARLTFAGAERN